MTTFWLCCTTQICVHVMNDPRRSHLFVAAVTVTLVLVAAQYHHRYRVGVSYARQRGYTQWCAELMMRCTAEQSFGLILCGIIICGLSVTANSTYGINPHLFLDWLVVVSYILAWLASVLFYAGCHHNQWVQRIFYVFDYTLGCALYGPLWAVSLLPCLAQMHSQLLFNSAVVRGLERHRTQKSSEMLGSE